MNREIGIKENKDLLVQMLKCFHNFCEKNHIKYYAGYGTLLGAVRHQGFIPWDDDLDVVMLREDYEKFLLCAKNWNSFYGVKSYKDDYKYPYNFAKIYDKRTTLTEFLWNDYEMGIYIDIFPLDKWPDNENKIIRIRNLQKLIKIKAYRIGRMQGIKKNVALSILKPLLSCISLQFLINKIEKITSDNKTIEGFIGNVAANNYSMKEKMEEKWFAEQILLPFEDTSINAPKKYDCILQQLYGDYMTPPPIEKQQSHHTFSAYWKNEEDTLK